MFENNLSGIFKIPNKITIGNKSMNCITNIKQNNY